ncbi:uncharacterized protein MELLADRAFT_124174 [Melampsora larici-populina 98AG31]|uniref:Secreted protein n=1 Tax=Melampsora larici-populina (strain 98AG31 / pathotype 3-4-7) TaxID=747676 RepID=F4S7W9_MELLP|nr:uncharacterized protein MELLADRAFT_124174 [Melampsora larici-populina 98AG31]EGF99290.1 secreted protein [Melampsora larici-populina 98AG31]
MFHQSFKFAALVSAVCLCALVSSVVPFTVTCTGGYQGGSDPADCWGDKSDDSQRNCEIDSCSNGVHKWAQMDNCRLGNSGPSIQRCEEYEWHADNKVYSCYNHARYEYTCSPKNPVWITCTNCRDGT